MSSPARRIILSIALAVSLLAPAHAQYTLDNLASFNGQNGSNVWSTLVIDSVGNLYGTTFGGGANTKGTVFEIAAGTSTITTLVSFNGTNGQNPYTGLVADADGNLYGTTTGGGASNIGTVFEVDAVTHALTTLVTFTGANGSSPIARLAADASGNLFGTTELGGANNNGTVFEIAAGTHAFSTIASFNGTNGSDPRGTLLIDSSGNLFGTTWGGGSLNKGVVYEIAAGSNTINVLATFDGTNGSLPFGGLVADGAGNMYGTTYWGGGSNLGTAFEIPTGTTTINTLVTFTGANGSHPPQALAIDNNGNLFGTTFSGGPTVGNGTVFELASGTHNFSTLLSFAGPNGGSDGANPSGGLIIDGQGNLYGTTGHGGFSNDGMVFVLSPVPEPATGTLAVLAVLAVLSGKCAAAKRERKAKSR